MYKLHINQYGQQYISTLNSNGDTLNIPMDEANTDYQAYLKFLEDGGVPEPAEVSE